MRIDSKYRDQECIFAKMKFIEESQEQEKESVHIKAEMTRLEELRYKERIRLKEKRILMDYKRTIIEKENLHIRNMVEDERIMKVNTSGLFRAQKLFLCTTPRGNPCKIEFK